MKTNVNIIMEETGCNEEQAQLSLKDSNDNLEKAIKSIASRLKCIDVIKSRFLCRELNIYGLFILIVNLQKEIIIRQATTVANNPAIFESELDSKWHIFEKRLYALRLHEGSLLETTRKLEQDLNWQINSNYKQVFFQKVREKKEGELVSLLRDIISGLLSDTDVKIMIKMEELSLNQFRELTDEKTSLIQGRINGDNQDRGIVLEIELLNSIEKKDSVDVERLKVNDIVLTRITDNRDISHYLSKLLGGKKKDSLIPLTSTVEHVKFEGNHWIVNTRFSPGITGRAVVDKKTRIKVIDYLPEKIANRKLRLWISVAVIVVSVVVYFLVKLIR